MEKTLCAKCGRECVSNGFSAGYATLRDDSRVCYDCADGIQLEEMDSATVFSAYVSMDGRMVTTWTGGTLAMVRQSRSLRSGFGRQGQLYVRAVDRNGCEWYGRNGGAGMCINLRRAVPR